MKRNETCCLNNRGRNSVLNIRIEIQREGFQLFFLNNNAIK